jgi:hypothetical protein
MTSIEAHRRVDDAAVEGGAWVLAVIAGLGLLLAYAAICAISPLNGEDYALAMPLDLNPATSMLGWICERSQRQIVGWNARFGEQLAILWLALGKPAFVVANTVSFAALCALVASYARGRLAIDRSLALSGSLTAASTFLIWPRLELFFWETAAAGYLQPTVLTLVVLLPFFFPEVRRLLLRSSWVLVVAVVLAVPAGAAFENVGPAVGLAMLGVTLNVRRHDRPMALRLAAVATGYALGWALLLLAPSTAHRAQYYHDAFNVPPWSLAYLLRRSLNVARIFLETSGPFLGVIAFAAGLAWWRAPDRRKVFPKDLWLLAGTATLSVAPVAFSPYTEPRAFTWFWVALLIVGVRTFDLLRQACGRWAVRVVAILGVAAVGVSAWLGTEYAVFRRAVSAREAMILAGKASGRCRDAVSVSLISTATSPRFLNNREEWVAASLDQVSAYYGCALTLTTGKAPD